MTVDPTLAVPFNVTEVWLVMLSVLLDPVSSSTNRSGMLTVRATVSAVITGVFTAAWVRVAVLPAASMRDPVKVLAAIVMAPLSVLWMV